MHSLSVAAFLFLVLDNDPISFCIGTFLLLRWPPDFLWSGGGAERLINCLHFATEVASRGLGPWIESKKDGRSVTQEKDARYLCYSWFASTKKKKKKMKIAQLSMYRRNTNE